MGHSRTCTYQLQMDRVGGGQDIIGTESIRQSKEYLSAFHEKNPAEYTGQGYLWPQTARGRQSIAGDYLRIYWIDRLLTVQPVTIGVNEESKK